MTFDKDDVSFLKCILKSLLHVSEATTATASFFISRFAQSEKVKLWEDALEHQGDPELVERLRVKIAEYEKQFVRCEGTLLTLLARIEREHEQIEAAMVVFDRLFPDPPPPSASGS